MQMTVPVEGNGVRQGTNWTKTADGRVVAAQPGIALEAPTMVSDQFDNNQPPPKPPPKEKSPIEEFHPSLDPTKFRLEWDEKTGRARQVPRMPEQTPASVEDTGGDDGGELPELGEQHDTIVEAVTQRIQPTQDANGDLGRKVDQLSELLIGLVTAQLNGKSLSDVLGQQKPAEPDYSQLDLYDPQTLANFIKDTVSGATAPLHQAVQQAARREDVAYVANQFGKEPNYHAKYGEAVKLMEQNPSMSLTQAYNLVTAIQTALSPHQQPRQNGAQPSTTRTLTPAQANVKRDQAARLPSNGGMRGAGEEAMPSHIKGLGQMIAYNLQKASLGG